jgi:alkylation response protein AidB-like acyl-CoA dehydrogenase
MADTFSDEQVEFADLAAKVFAAMGSDGDVDPAGVRAQLAEIGLPLMAVAEEFGGLGLDECDVVLILEEAGYADAPVPIAETIGVVAPLLARYGSEEQRETWLPALAGGDTLGTTVCPGTGVGSRTGADVALVERDGRVHLVGVDGTHVAGAPCLAEPAASVAELRARAAWVTAAVLNGVSRRLLDLSLEYARAREQFGVAIGSFQAVKHKLAEMASGVESARPTAWSAARALAGRDPERGVAASVAKVLAGHAGALANDHALQIHGAMGFTKEHPVHRWLLLGHELESRWGTAGEHAAALGEGALAGGSLVERFVP